MSKRIRQGAVVALLLMAALSHAQEEPVSLTALARETGAQLMWDPYRGVGTLWKAGTTVTFRLGEESLIINYSKRNSIDPVVRAGGRLQLSSDTARLLRNILGERSTTEGRLNVAAIYIDPGHGGKDSGAVGRFSSGTTVYEKDIVLGVGRYLHAMLQQRYPQREVVLSRKEDAYRSLEERTELANQVTTGENEIMVFVSLHANASFNSEASGFEVWYLPPDYRRKNLVEAAEVGVDDPDVLSILNTIKEEEYTLGSIMLAQSILRSMERTVGEVSPNRGIKEESWFVVRNAEMPSVLVELGFVTNEEEATRLTERGYLRKLAEGIYEGVVSFVEEFEGQ